MRKFWKTLKLALIITPIVPGWLFASGNLPSLHPHNELVIRAVNDSFPELSGISFQKSHRFYKRLRGRGIQMPLSYNERMLKIAGIRSHTIKICNTILADL